MEIKDKDLKKTIIEEIKENLEDIDEGKHKHHKLTCVVDLIVSYDYGEIKLEDVDVIQGECETCRDEDGTPYCLWG